MDIRMLSEQISKLASLRERRRKIEESMKKINFTGHQENLSVKLGDLSLTVTELHVGTGYRAKVKRGYEMIHLGAKKVFQSAFDEVVNEINATEQLIRELTSEQGASDDR